MSSENKLVVNNNNVNNGRKMDKNRVLPTLGSDRTKTAAANLKKKYDKDQNKRNEPSRSSLQRTYSPNLIRGGNSYATKKTNFRNEEIIIEKPHKTKEKTPPKKEWWEHLMDTGADLIKHFAPLLLGMGDYDEDILERSTEPVANSILAASTEGEKGIDKRMNRYMSNVPVMHEDGEVTRICHREYIGDVLSSQNAFVPLQFSINPGMKETYPWLSAVAANYTSYQFLGQVFEFVSEGSEYTNSAGLGYVALSTQYNPAAQPYKDKRSLLNSQFADAAKPSKSFMHWEECMPGKVSDPHRLVRSSNVPSTSSIVDYDVGNVTLAVGGNVASGAVIGELWVSYDVLLFTPKSENFINTEIDYYCVASNSTTSTDNAILGTAWTPGPATINTFTPVFSGGMTITFPIGSRGRYLVDLVFVRTTTTTAGSGGYNTTLVGCTQVNGATPLGPSFIAGQTNVGQRNFYEVYADNATITFINSLSFFGAGTGNTIIVITQVPAGLSSDIVLSKIFDYGGVNRDANYEKLMKLIAKEAVEFDFDESENFTVTEKDDEFWFAAKNEPSVRYKITKEEAFHFSRLEEPFNERFLLEIMLRNMKKDRPSL